MTTQSFDLDRLLTTVFKPQSTERIAVFIDLPNPSDIRDAKFLQDPSLGTQRIAYEAFYQPLLKRTAGLTFASVEFYAYQPTGGSNLDLPTAVTDRSGQSLRLVADVLSKLDIV